MERKEEVKFGGAAMSLPADLSCLQGGGGAEGEAALALLEKQLICPICLELFNKPVVILPCQHNLCRKCANELYQPSLFQARTTMLLSSGRFRCPSCRQEVVLDRHGVYGLQRNLLVENIIDVYKQEVSNNSNATSPLPLPPAPPAQATCSDHEGEKVNIYCLTCQVPTCSLCKVFGAHQSCQVAPLTDVYQQQKDELSEEVGSLVAFNNRVQALIDGLEETCRNIEDNCRTQKQTVCDKFNRVFSILEERQKAMTQRISSEQEEKTGHAQTLVRCYGDSVAANTKLVEKAASSMEEPDMAAFVQNSRELITKVIAATGVCPAETLKPGYESMSHYRYDFSRQESALKSIDFLKLVEEVPEEPEVEQEPEEPKSPFVQNAEPQHHQENSTQDLGPAVEPVKEPLISPPVESVTTAAPKPVVPVTAAAPTPVEPVEPVTTAAPTPVETVTTAAPKPVEPVTAATPTPVEPVRAATPTPVEPVEPVTTAAPKPVPPAAALVSDSVEPAGAVLQAENGDRDTTDGGSSIAVGQKDQKEEQKEEAQGCAAPVPAKEGIICEDQEGMSTQQREGGEAQSAAGDWTVPSETEEKQESQEEEEEEKKTEEEEDALFYPGWYKASSWCRLSPVPPQTAGGTLLEAAVHTEAPGAAQDVSEPQTQTPTEPPHRLENHNLPQPPLHESHSQPQKDPADLGSAFIPAPQLGLVEEEEEEEDMQGWVCLPATVDKSLSFEEGLSGVGGCSLGESCSGGASERDTDKSELCDGGLEDDEEVEQQDEGENVAEFDPSGFSVKKEEDGVQMDTGAAESESVQAVTLLFYLLAFLVILQRFWAYIGCFICT